MRIAPDGGRFTHDMWIPWCTAEDSGRSDLFRLHHIALWDQCDTEKTPIFCIWQDFGLGRQRVRYSSSGRWEDPGDPVPGDSAVGGDRSLIVGQAVDGRYLLNIVTYTLPADPPGPIPFAMAFAGSTGTYEGHIGDGELARIDYRISGVQNAALGGGVDPEACAMRLSHTNFCGPVVIPPNGISHAFDGQPLTGTWRAVLDIESADAPGRPAAVRFYVV